MKPFPNVRYNLKTDLGENTDVVKENSEIAERLSKQLFNYLNEVSAKFPMKDSEYNPEKENEHLQKVIEERLPQLEKQRLSFLSKDFDPGNNWWGSEVTTD